MLRNGLKPLGAGDKIRQQGHEVKKYRCFFKDLGKSALSFASFYPRLRALAHNALTVLDGNPVATGKSGRTLVTPLAPRGYKWRGFRGGLGDRCDW